MEMETESDTPLLQRIAPDLLAFALGLSAAWLLGWRTPDLVWGLWLSSLIIGYATILITIGSAGIIGWRTVVAPETNPTKRSAAIMGGMVAGLFLVGFFTFHFGMFHYVHGIFLGLFFPPNVPGYQGGFNRSGGLPYGPGLIIQLIGLYWPVLLATLIAERKGVFGPIHAALRLKDAGSVSEADEDQEPTEVSLTKRERRAAKKLRQRAAAFNFMKPYTNVIRMHLLIFFFAGASALKLDHFLIYAVVYAVYFFPWSAIFRKPQATES